MELSSGERACAAEPGATPHATSGCGDANWPRGGARTTVMPTRPGLTTSAPFLERVATHRGLGQSVRAHWVHRNVAEPPSVAYLYASSAMPHESGGRMSRSVRVTDHLRLVGRKVRKSFAGQPYGGVVSSLAIDADSLVRGVRAAPRIMARIAYDDGDAEVRPALVRLLHSERSATRVCRILTWLNCRRCSWPSRHPHQGWSPASADGPRWLGPPRRMRSVMIVRADRAISAAFPIRAKTAESRRSPRSCAAGRCRA